MITSPFSFVASANCAIYEGATPVFADIDPRTLNLDPAAVEAAVTRAHRAIVAVDIFGYPCELEPLRELCDRHGLALDRGRLRGARRAIQGAPLGSHGHPAAFAFYPNKQMTTGEGGAIDDGRRGASTQLLVSLRNQGRPTPGGWLEHARLGYNYRLDDVSAALGVAQLEKLDEILAARAEVAARYAELLARRRGVEPPIADDADHAAPGSSTSCASARRWTATRSIAQLARARRRDRAVPPVDPPPAVHARALRLPEGMLPVSEDAARGRSRCRSTHARA